MKNGRIDTDSGKFRNINVNAKKHFTDKKNYKHD